MNRRYPQMFVEMFPPLFLCYRKSIFRLQESKRDMSNLTPSLWPFYGEYIGTQIMEIPKFWNAERYKLHQIVTYVNNRVQLRYVWIALIFLTGWPFCLPGHRTFRVVGGLSKIMNDKLLNIKKAYCINTLPFISYLLPLKSPALL